MKASERYKPQFVRPKKMFKRAEYKKVVKGKVFGVTLSTGAQRLWHVRSPFTQHEFARLVDQKLGPFLAAAFPQHSRRVILLDGEPLLHAPAAIAAMERNHVKRLPERPACSPAYFGPRTTGLPAPMAPAKPCSRGPGSRDCRFCSSQGFRSGPLGVCC